MEKGQPEQQQDARILHAASTLNSVSINLLERGHYTRAAAALEKGLSILSKSQASSHLMSEDSEVLEGYSALSVPSEQVQLVPTSVWRSRHGRHRTVSDRFAVYGKAFHVRMILPTTSNEGEKNSRTKQIPSEMVPKLVHHFFCALLYNQALSRHLQCLSQTNGLRQTSFQNDVLPLYQCVESLVNASRDMHLSTLNLSVAVMNNMGSIHVALHNMEDAQEELERMEYTLEAVEDDELWNTMGADDVTIFRRTVEGCIGSLPNVIPLDE